MVSTPSPRLRWEEQAAGENLNTWGAPKLNNAMLRLEEAICGRLAKVLVGNYSLTSNNYAADEARMMFLDFSGALGGAATVTIPSVEKVYMVRNLTGQAVILSAGGTTLSVANGNTIVCACDGSNVVQIATSAADIAVCLAAAKAYTDAATIAAGSIPVATGLSDVILATGPTGGGSLGVPAWVSPANIRTKLGLGTSAVINTGTAGGVIPLLNGANTWAAPQTFSAAPVFGDQPGSRTALGLGGAAVLSVGTGAGTVAAGNDSRFAAVIPSGGIILWSGSAAAIPAGFVLCDGTAGTPDLRGRFLVGAGGAYGVGAVGGNQNLSVTFTTDAHALSIGELPSHDHGFVDNGHAHGINDPGHFHSFNAMQIPWNGVNNDMAAGAQGSKYAANTASAFTGITVASGGANITFTAQGSGTGHAHTGTTNAWDNRPPYYALCYIMKT